MSVDFKSNAQRIARSNEPDQHVIIVGAGISGLGAAIRLRAMGIKDFLILERSQGVGGTWRDNRYPGIAVDITSFTYSYSFEQNPNWSRFFAPGRELQRYAERVAAKYGLYRHARFNVSVTSATFDEARHTWILLLDDGSELTSRHLISATGGLITPKMPDIPGLESFKGEIIHTAQWPSSIELSGKRVAVIGTGATSVQLVPQIAKVAAHLDLYQRTPIWVLPKLDREVPALVQSLFRWAPLSQRALRAATDAVSESVMVIGAIYYRQFPWIVSGFEKIAKANVRSQLADRPDLWEALTPRYGFLCKRPTFSNDYFSTIGRADVELVTTPISRVTESGVETMDGRDRQIDVLVLATGYKTFEKGNIPSYPVYGRNGVELGDFWDRKRFQAYEGVSVPGFPNFYMMLGPYALIGTSYFKMVEGNAIHVARCVEEALRRSATAVEVRQSAHDAYFRDILQRQQSTVFINHNCAGSNSYYFDKHGDAPMLRPSTSAEMLWRAAHFPLDHYEYTQAPASPSISTPVRVGSAIRTAVNSMRITNSEAVP